MCVKFKPKNNDVICPNHKIFIVNLKKWQLKCVKGSSEVGDRLRYAGGYRIDNCIICVETNPGRQGEC